MNCASIPQGPEVDAGVLLVWGLIHAEVQSSQIRPVRAKRMRAAKKRHLLSTGAEKSPEIGRFAVLNA